MEEELIDLERKKKDTAIKFILFYEFGDGVPSKEVNGKWIHRKDREKELRELSYSLVYNLKEDLIYKDKQIKIERNLEWNFNFKVHNVEDYAKEIMDDNPLYFNPFLNEWYIWDKKELIWTRTKDAIIFENIKRVFKAQGLSTSTNRTTILNALKDESQARKPEEPKDTWVQIGNKIYDISSDEEYYPIPKYFIKTKLPFNVGDTEETPYLDSLFKDWLGDKKNILYDIAALTISPKNFLETFFFFQGGGSDGKSVYTKILQTLVGIENTKSVNLESVSDPKERFETSFLIDKYLCLLGDGNFPVLKNTKFLKEACGSTDLISAQKKGSSEVVDFESKATIIGSFNTLPPTTDLTDGFFRRMHLTFWNNKFDGKTDVYVKLVVEHHKEFNNLMTRCIRRLREIYKTRTIEGKLSIPDTRNLYFENSDVIKQFLKKESVEDVNGVFTANKAYNEFKLWAESNRYNSFDFKTFKDNLGEQTSISYQRTWVYVVSDGNVYRNEEDIPERYQPEKFDYTQITLYRGVNLKCSLGSYDSNSVNSSEEFVE